MPGPFEVSGDEISNLGEETLPHLLRKLLYLESKSNKILPLQLEVSSNTKAADGGYDGIIEWNPPPDRTLFLPTNKVILQSKATTFYPGECINEFLNDGMLKPKLEEKFGQGFSYILVTKSSVAGKGKQDRILNFKKALEISHHTDFADNILIDVYDQDKIAEWTNQYLSAIVWVKEVVGHQIDLSLAIYNLLNA